MGDAQTVDRCIRHEGKYRNVGVYVVVVIDGDCPVEVQVSLAFDKFESIREKASARLGFKKLAELVNVALQHGLPVYELIKFLKSPPCEMSGIIGDALIAALDG